MALMPVVVSGSATESLSATTCQGVADWVKTVKVAAAVRMLWASTDC